MQFTEEEVQPNIYRAERLFFFRPVFFTSLFLCVGIAFAYAQRFQGISSFWLLCAFPALLLVFLRAKRGEVYKRAAAISLCILAFFIGSLSLDRQLDDFSDCAQTQAQTTVRATLIENAVFDELTILRFSDLYLDGGKTKGELTAYLPTSSAQKYGVGDEFVLYGKLYTDVSFFSEYGFRAEDIKNRACYYMRDMELIKTGKSDNPFYAISERVRKTVYAGMEEDAASVTLGILLGDTRGIAEDLYDNIRFGGIAHIFAVSGLHVGALFAFCIRLVEKTKGRIPKPVRFLLVGFLIVFYAGTCGFTSSVVRAGVICLTFYASSLLRLHADFLERLGLAALVILCVSPVALFEVGFQLSFLACLGIGCLGLPIRNGLTHLFSRRDIDPTADDEPPTVIERIRSGVISAFSMSLSAQVLTAPVLLNAFSYLSVWGLLLNVLFVPLISIAFSWLLAFVFIGCLLPVWWSRVLLSLPNVFFHALLFVFEIFDFSRFIIAGIKLSGSGIVCYYIGLIVWSDKLNLRTWQKGVISALFLMMFVMGTVFVNL